MVGVSGVADGVDSSEGLGEHELTKAAIRTKGIHLRTLIYSNLLSVLQCLVQQGGFHFLPKTVTVFEISDFRRGYARRGRSVAVFTVQLFPDDTPGASILFIWVDLELHGFIESKLQS